MLHKIKSIVFYRSTSYKHTFNNPNGEKVLADLKRFCYAVTPTADINNPNATYLAEGRREVWLRIQAHLNLSDDEIYNLVEDYDNE